MNLSEFRFSRAEWRLLLPQLVMLIAALLLMGLVCGGAWYEMQRQSQMAAAAHQRLASASQQLADAEQARTDWEKYSPRFAVFYAIGIVGQEDRMQWVEVLTKLGRDNPTMNLRFSIAPQARADVMPSPAADLQVHATRIRLDFSPLHEVAMQQVLEAIQRQLNGLPVLRGCRLALPGESQQAISQGQLMARCDFQVLTFSHISSTTPGQEGGV
ncbi:hypothetical protein HNQ59_002776 [Chitinivorax tropicus]|uniref:Uncharacterized protein n=1 Tax=Chitinivorax tropicus TaxID=714531 RepID=A0A840MJV1_9PROT|nr:hypothetical protein [Chitinivorax tropicus]MBB5019474.1 hypothetical protein [Chitinivorax tropicus]